MKAVPTSKSRSDKENLTVNAMMSRNPHTVKRDETLADVEKIMQNKSIRHLPVVDDYGKLVGLISHRDLLRFSVSDLSELTQVDRGILHSQMRVSEIMCCEVQTVTPETSLKTAAILMAEKKYGCLPVTEDMSLVGIITEGDFLRFFAEGISGE